MAKNPSESQVARWFTVWLGPSIDEVCKTAIAAKKHAAWLHWTHQKSTWWRHRVTVTGPDREDVPFDDYEFKDGESRRVKRPRDQ